MCTITICDKYPCKVLFCRFLYYGSSASRVSSSTREVVYCMIVGHNFHLFDLELLALSLLATRLLLYVGSVKLTSHDYIISLQSTRERLITGAKTVKQHAPGRALHSINSVHTKDLGSLLYGLRLPPSRARKSNNIVRNRRKHCQCSQCKRWQLFPRRQRELGRRLDRN